jgi:hypothetical protein
MWKIVIFLIEFLSVHSVNKERILSWESLVAGARGLPGRNIKVCSLD